MERHALTDEQWERVRPLRPPRSRGRGRPRVDDRTIVDGILWRLATGAPWRDVPAAFGPWRTVDSRCRRWQIAGVWDRALAALPAAGDAAGALDGSLHCVDGTVVRAHQHAAGAKKGVVIEPAAGAGAASRRSSTSGPSGAGSRSPAC